ncbi:hypothetical protein HanIR_Chr06g0279191 [Helianthus annuus]|nr:hypothetical protein HanIR_Chr06g0279191 [Helianthus annuus]
MIGSTTVAVAAANGGGLSGYRPPFTLFVYTEMFVGTKITDVVMDGMRGMVFGDVKDGRRRFVGRGGEDEDEQ